MGKLNTLKTNALGQFQSEHLIDLFPQTEDHQIGMEFIALISDYVPLKQLPSNMLYYPIPVPRLLALCYRSLQHYSVNMARGCSKDPVSRRNHAFSFAQ